MDIHTLSEIVYPLFKTFEKKYDICLESVKTETSTLKTCTYMTTKRCGKKIYKDSFCKEHYESIESHKIDNLNYGIVKSNKQQKKEKDRLKIDELMNKVIIQKPVKLYRHELGLLEKESEFIFNNDFQVIGKLNGTELSKLTTYDANKCEMYGYVYSMSIVDKEL